MVTAGADRQGRRHFLRLAASLLLAAAARPARASAGLRIVTFDWPLTATALSLDADVVGLPSPEYYNLSTVEPALPANIVDVGLLYTPSFEILDELHPDLIIIPPDLAYAAPMFSRIAETAIIDLSGSGDDPLGAARAGTSALADRLHLTGAGAALSARYDAALAAAHPALSALRQGTVLIGSFADDRHLTVYGQDTLLGRVLADLGLANALAGMDGANGRSIIGVERLARVPDAAILLLANGGNNAVPENSAVGIFWQALPAVREKRVTALPAVLEDGALPAAIRLCHLLTAEASAP